MEQLKFSIQSLLTGNSEVVTGPMSPILFAREMTEITGFGYNRLARVTFEDNEILQVQEEDGLTGNDILIIGTQYRNTLQLTLWVDMGTGGMPVTMSFQNDREIHIAPPYRMATFARKLKEDEILQIFDTIFNQPELIAIGKR